jgi:hypothetical protein
MSGPIQFFLTQGSTGPEVASLIEDLRALGLEISLGDYFTDQVESALKVFQQSYHDYSGIPLKIDGKLDLLTAMALDTALGRSRNKPYFDDDDFPPMSAGGCVSARRAALIAHEEYSRASGEHGGNNLGPDIMRYQAGVSQIASSWSTQFATWCYREAGSGFVAELGAPQSGRELVHAAQAQGWMQDRLGAGLLPGDMLVWYAGEPSITNHPHWRGHVGIVWSFKGTNVVSLEGDRGPYPSLVRPYSHNSASFVRSTTDDRFKEGVGVIRFPARNLV